MAGKTFERYAQTDPYVIPAESVFFGFPQGLLIASA
jgi:hypothetical protein